MTAPYTRLGNDGGVRRYGSFAGKMQTSGGPHPVGIITQLGHDGGVRRYLVNGFAGKTGTAVVPPPITEPTPGGRISGGYFSRGHWHALKDAWRTEDEARQRARDAKRRKEREALERAAFEAASARAVVETSETEHDGELARLYTALAAATGAETVMQAITKANEAVRIAKALQADIEEEEEAIALLLMH